MDTNVMRTKDAKTRKTDRMMGSRKGIQQEQTEATERTEEKEGPDFLQKVTKVTKKTKGSMGGGLTECGDRMMGSRKAGRNRGG